MEKLTFYDINKIFRELEDRKSSSFHFHLLLDTDNTSLDFLKQDINTRFHAELDRLGEFEVVREIQEDLDGYGDVMIFRVLHFKDHDVYVKVTGSWSSYSGMQFESIYEVKPVTKTVTVYE